MTATVPTRPKPACADDPEAWFSDDEAVQEECKAVCAGCPIAAACFAGAVERDEQAGIWAGEVFGPTFQMAGPDEPWVRPQVFAPIHGRNATYISGCRCRPCTDSHAEYVAANRSERKWAAPVEPDSCAEPLPLFEIFADTAIGRISA